MVRRRSYATVASRVLAAAIGLAGLVLAARYPLGGACGMVGFLAVGALLVARPSWWLLALPCVIVIGDLYPWTGSLLVSESDLFCLAALAVLLWRDADQWGRFIEHKWLVALWLPIALSLSVSVLRGWVNLPHSVPGDQLSLYVSQWNALRVAKGITWGIAFAPFVFTRVRETNGMREIAYSLHASALFVGLGVVIERMLAVGLFNFREVYRATGPIYSMHIGGQHIDAFWVIVLPLLFLPNVGDLMLPKLCQRFLLLSVALYAIVATLSRGLLALAAVDVVACVVTSFLFAGRRHGARVMAVLLSMGILVVASLIAIVALGPIESRFSQSSADMNTRWQHWTQLCRASNDGLASDAVGHGSGTVPSMIAHADGKPARPAELVLDFDEQVAIRLRPGRSFFVEQLVDANAPGPWTFRGDIRRKGAAQCGMILCEKTLIQSLNCVTAALPAPGVEQHWKSFEVTINPSESIGNHRTLLRLPVTLALSAGGQSGNVDIKNLVLEDAEGNRVLENSDFHAGSRHWFFTSDDHLAWHAKNVWVHLFVEQGWFGVVSFAWLSIGTFVLVLFRAVRYPDITSWILVLSIAGILSMGLIDSIIDTPWITQLTLLLFTAGQACTPERVPRVD